jgi:hypothetical protein
MDFGHDHIRGHWVPDAARMKYPLGKYNFGVLDLLIMKLTQQVADTIQACVKVAADLPTLNQTKQPRAFHALSDQCPDPGE